MNIKRFDRKGQWGIDSAKRYFHREFADHDFNGVMALLYFDDVKETNMWNYLGRPVKVCDKGMKWLQFIPHNAHYAVKAMMSREGIINLWYIDVISDYGYTDDGVVFITDLYVDIILYPDGAFVSDDFNEELNEALAEKEITQELYDLALKTKERLINGPVSNPDSLAEFCIKYLRKMENSYGCY